MNEEHLGQADIVLRPSKLKWIGVMCVGLVFTSSGLFKIVEGGFLPWLIVIFFGTCAFVAMIPLLTKPYLRLNAAGFEQYWMGRRTNFQWHEVSNFRSTWPSLVCFDYQQDANIMLERTNQRKSPGSSTLGDTFGMLPKELAELMNSYCDNSNPRRKREITE